MVIVSFCSFFIVAWNVPFNLSGVVAWYGNTLTLVGFNGGAGLIKLHDYVYPVC